MTTLTKNHNEQLFTDLTYEEAAVIEGGYIKIKRLHAIRLTKDDRRKDRRDEFRIYVGNELKWTGRIEAGQILDINTFAKRGFEITLRENDGLLKGSEKIPYKGYKKRQDDFLLTFEQKNNGAKYRMSVVA